MSDDLDLLIEAVQSAGEIALSYWGKNPSAWDKGGSAGPVSQADIETDDHLRVNLCAARPDYGWLSEETKDTPDRLSSRNVFIVDPIDGTRSFLDGAKTWGISAAVVKDGTPVAGVIYMPALQLTYAAAKGAGATLNGSPIAASHADDLARARVLAARKVMLEEHWTSTVPAFDRHFRPSLAYRLALVAEGKFDAMLTTRPTWEWDIAAGALIATEAGARVSDQTGAPCLFNNATPQLDGLMAAAPAIHAGLGTHLARFTASPD